MGSFFDSRQNCYCAFCKTPRRVYMKKRISFLNVLASAMATIVIMMALWQGYDPRAIIAFVVCLGLSAVFVRIRWRLSIVCKVCGFDPLTYKLKPEVAAQRVRERLDVRKNDPKYLLARPLNLPGISAKKANALKNNESGQIVSRTI